MKPSLLNPFQQSTAFGVGIQLLVVVCVSAAPLAPLPNGDEIEIEVGPPNLLVTEALEFLETSPIKPAVEKLVQRKQISAAKLPPPAAIPAGALQLELSDQQLPPEARFSTKASWSMQVPKAVDSQFVYFLQLVHISERGRAEGYRTWGVAKAEFNGQRYASLVMQDAGRLGDHRIMGMLVAWSIKTEESFVLDVVEASFKVAAPGKGAPTVD